MADTVDFALTETAWIDISTTVGLEAYITNGGDAVVYFLQSETVPNIAETAYHRLNPSDNVSYSITLPEIIYARSSAPVGKLSATPGLL